VIGGVKLKPAETENPAPERGTGFQFGKTRSTPLGAAGNLPEIIVGLIHLLLGKSVKVTSTGDAQMTERSKNDKF
jgi:hypothetical protein